MRALALVILVAVAATTPLGAVCLAASAEDGGCCCPKGEPSDDVRFEPACCCVGEAEVADEAPAPAAEVRGRDARWALAAVVVAVDVGAPVVPRAAVAPSLRVRAPPPTTLLAQHTLLLC